MCALLALKFSTSDIVADFEMKTNDDNSGCFDDVVLQVTFMDGQSHTFLFQLKHCENTKKCVTATMLQTREDKFNILKYANCITQFEDSKKGSFILYTNWPTSVENGSVISLGSIGKKEKKLPKYINEEVVVRELREPPNLDPKKLLLIDTQTMGTKFFQFAPINKSVVDLDESLKRFYFFVNQTDTTGAQSLINAMLKEKCGITDSTYSPNFIEFMKTWSSGNLILTKDDVVVKLAELTLTPFIQPISDKMCEKSEKSEKSNLLKEAIMKFDMTIVRDTNEEVIANIWNETASDEEISLTSLKYGLRPKGTEDLPSKDRSKVLWHLNKVPLIVKAEDCDKEQVKHAIRLLEKIKKRKVVLLANATKEEFPGWNIFQDLSDLSNENDVYKSIVNKFAVSLQGRPSIFLDQLLNFDQGNDRTIETTELIKMTQESIQIGRRQKEEKAFETYISRNVSISSLDIKKMFELSKKKKYLLIIYNIPQSWNNKAIQQSGLNVMELDQYLNLIDRKKIREVDILLTINKWPEVPFNDICKKMERKMSFLDFGAETIKSQGKPVDEKQIFTYFTDPLNVIFSPAGMGKRMLMSRLSSKCPSSYWSVRVNLIDHKTIFKKEREYKEILHHLVEEEKDPLVVKIRPILLQNKKMYFFLDGLDEIDSDCLQVVLNFIEHISKLGHRVWVTSREHLEQTVSRRLNIFPIKIEELTEEQQKAYIQKRLKSKFKQDEVKDIINKIYATVNVVKSRNLLEVPLQLFILTENFLNNKNLWTESNQEIFVLTKMYKIFFQAKKKHQHQKLGMHEYENQLAFDTDLYLKQYELLALKSCLDTKTFYKLNINLGRSQKFLEKLKPRDQLGIVSRVTDDNQAIFTHHTYAQYFACVWLKNNLEKVLPMQDDLFTKKNQDLKIMFDIMLAGNSALHLAVIYRNTDLVLKHLNECKVKDKGGRSPLHLLCTYGVEHSSLSLTEDTWWFLYAVKHISCKEFTKNYIEGVSTQYREILNMLLQCNELQNDGFRRDCLEYAIRFHNLFAVEKFVEKFKNSISLESLFEHYNTETLAYYSSLMGYTNLLRAVIEKDLNVLSVKIGKCHLTLLHVAIIGIKTNNNYEQTLLNENIKMMTTLIKLGLDVNAQCSCKKTALHLASELDDDAIVKFLLTQKANIDLTDAFGRNALHFALKNSEVKIEIVKALINKGIDVETRDMDGKTPLHLCCREGHQEALEKLLGHGLDVKVVTKHKINLLHAIFRQSRLNVEMMDFLISKDADVNGKDCYGRTVLHYACIIDFSRKPIQYMGDVNATNIYAKKGTQHILLSNGSKTKNIIIPLLKKGAIVNAKDSANRSVLHYAAFRRNYNFITLLLEHNADIKAVCDSGKTVLHAAFENEPSPDAEVIQLLLSSGVDANKRDENQKTALDYAVTSTKSDVVVDILFHAKAHEQLMSTDYVTFLHYAVYHGNYFAVKLFLRDGLDLDNIDANNEEYPLYFAVENEHLRSDLLQKMTKFIRDCKKKANFGRKQIIELLKKYFLEGNGSDRVSLFNINLCFLFVFIL
jgi:ankyrin repeat protein